MCLQLVHSTHADTSVTVSIYNASNILHVFTEVGASNSNFLHIIRQTMIQQGFCCTTIYIHERHDLYVLKICILSSTANYTTWSTIISVLVWLWITRVTSATSTAWWRYFTELLRGLFCLQWWWDLFYERLWGSWWSERWVQYVSSFSNPCSTQALHCTTCRQIMTAGCICLTWIMS